MSDGAASGHTAHARIKVRLVRACGLKRSVRGQWAVGSGQWTVRRHTHETSEATHGDEDSWMREMHCTPTTQPPQTAFKPTHTARHQPYRALSHDTAPSHHPLLSQLTTDTGHFHRSLRSHQHNLPSHTFLILPPFSFAVSAGLITSPVSSLTMSAAPVPAVLSVTAPMHGSNSSSSLASLEHLNTDNILSDDDVAININDAHNQLPPLAISHDDSDDSDDDNDSSDNDSKEAATQPPPTSSAAADILHRLASARILSGNSSTREVAIEMQRIERERSKRESSSLPPFAIQLLDSDEKPVATLQSDADDIFSLETFSALHCQRRAQGKQLIIAQVTTKDKNSTAFHSVVHSYYDALPLLRLLYRVQPTGDIRHRYHAYQTINPINPLTNTCIIGDVRFYMTEAVDVPQTVLPPTPSNGGRTTEVECVRARYLGSDYNFTFSRAFREKWLPHSVSASPSPTSSASPTSDSSPLSSSSSSPASSSSSSPASSPLPIDKDDHLAIIHTLLQQPQRPRQRAVGWSGSNADRLAALVAGGRPPVHEWRSLPFSRTMTYGVVWALYGLVAFLVFVGCLEGLINGDTDSSFDLGGSWYYLLLPPMSVLLDCLTSKLYERRELVTVWLVKAVLYALFYLVPFVFASGASTGDNVGRRLAMLVLAMCYLAYSVGWFVWLRRWVRFE